MKNTQLLKHFNQFLDFYSLFGTRRYRLLFLLLVASLFSVKAQVLVQGPDVTGSPDSIFDNHVSSIISTGADSLLIAWFGGELEGDTDNVIYTKRSFDGGLTWVNRDTLFEGFGDTLYRDPHLFYWRDTLYIIYNRQVGEGGISRALDSRLEYSFSLDDGYTWSAPSAINPGGIPAGKNIRIVAPFNDPVEINNKVVFGVHWREVGNSSPHVSLLYLDFSADTSYLVGDLNVSYKIVEPALLKENGVLHLYLRNDQQYIQYSKSLDFGLSWSNPINTKLVCSYSLSSVKEIAADSILVVWNNHRVSRDYLSVGLCRSYDLSDLYWKRDIDYMKSSRGQVSYPASLIYNWDSIGVSYTDRIHIGLKPNGKLDLRGSIKYLGIRLSDRNDLADFTAANDTIARSFLINRIEPLDSAIRLASLNSGSF
ncbi:MAG: exo-alpha-sialidase [Bacteroidetes bacterium]|nr:exo-alpha-sialidase [Bacteroidota bacterium]